MVTDRESEVSRMDDSISRQAAIDAPNEYFVRIGKLKRRGLNKGEKAISLDVFGAIKSLPPAQPERAKGNWIPVDSYSAFGGDEATWMANGNPIAYYYCSNCKQQARADEEGKDILSNFCPDCGADMRTKETDCNYERAVEQLEHDMLYEPTFNQDDGSM